MDKKDVDICLGRIKKLLFKATGAAFRIEYNYHGECFSPFTKASLSEKEKEKVEKFERSLKDITLTLDIRYY